MHRARRAGQLMRPAVIPLALAAALLCGTPDLSAAAVRALSIPHPSGAVIPIIGEELDPLFPIILGVILICLILLRSHFRKKD